MLAAERFTADLTQLPQGWFNHGPEVLRLLEVHRPRVVVELGSWLGASAIAMARTVRRWGGTVTCVDAWTGALSDEGGMLPGPPLMLVSCARAMVEAGVGANVRLIPSTTVAAAGQWQGPIDCLYVDADHSEAGVRADLEAWLPHVRPGGLVLGDDYAHPRYPGVARAWDASGLTLTRYQSAPPVRGGIQLVYAFKERVMAEVKPLSVPTPAPAPAPAAAPEKPATVRVRTLQAHTTGGVAHDVDDVYDVAADLVDTLAVQGKAVRADP